MCGCAMREGGRRGQRGGDPEDKPNNKAPPRQGNICAGMCVCVYVCMCKSACVVLVGTWKSSTSFRDSDSEVCVARRIWCSEALPSFSCASLVSSMASWAARCGLYEPHNICVKSRHIPAYTVQHRRGLVNLLCVYV